MGFCFLKLNDYTITERLSSHCLLFIEKLMSVSRKIKLTAFHLSFPVSVFNIAMNVENAANQPTCFSENFSPMLGTFYANFSYSLILLYVGGERDENQIIKPS